MRTFKVYKHATDGFEAVKLGFSWPGLFFGVLWMLVSGLWGYSAVWIVTYIAVQVLESVAGHIVPMAYQSLAYVALASCGYALWLLPGFFGNKWRSRRLEKDGYELVGTVQAKNWAVAVAQVSSPA